MECAKLWILKLIFALSGFLPFHQRMFAMTYELHWHAWIGTCMYRAQ